MTYLLDANVFIQAKNLHYGFDFCPAFWDWIDASHLAGTVFSIERVANELDAGGDELAHWAHQRPRLFLPPDAAVVPSLQTTAIWANGHGYDPAAVATFLQVADYYLAAHAHAHSYTIVTHEVAAPSLRRKAVLQGDGKKSYLSSIGRREYGDDAKTLGVRGADGVRGRQEGNDRG